MLVYKVITVDWDRRHTLEYQDRMRKARPENFQNSPDWESVQYTCLNPQKGRCLTLWSWPSEHSVCSQETNQQSESFWMSQELQVSSIYCQHGLLTIAINSPLPAWTCASPLWSPWSCSLQVHSPAGPHVCSLTCHLSSFSIFCLSPHWLSFHLCLLSPLPSVSIFNLFVAI